MIKELTLKTSQAALNGKTAVPTIRSATARLTMNIFVTFLSLLVQQTASMTRTLPIITITATNTRRTRVTTFRRLDHSTPSYKAAHAVAFSSRIFNSRGPRVRPCDPVEGLRGIPCTASTTTAGASSWVRDAGHLESPSRTYRASSAKRHRVNANCNNIAIILIGYRRKFRSIVFSEYDGPLIGEN